jgi:aspartate-semialdehyde dehydrogenase
LRLLQAPVFHGYCFNIWMELAEPIETEELESLLNCEPFSLSTSPEEQPSVVSAASSDQILLGAVERDTANPAGYWIWGAFDNLRVAALNAVRIAEEMMGVSSVAISLPSAPAAGTPSQPS